jgi:hypothetical protein
LSGATIDRNAPRKESVVKNLIGRFVVSLAIAAMLVGVGLSSASAASQVPFKAHFSGSLAFDGVSNIQLAGTGNASHLGRSTNSSAITIVGSASCGGFAIHGVETLTAADGDHLSWTVDGEACPTATAGVYQISAPYVVTGGTGRFAGATGGGAIVCVGDFGNGTFDFTVTGTISRHLS